MAKAFRAATRIEHGEEKDGANQLIVFEPGDIVRGLDNETMKHLWEQGALEEAMVVTQMDLDDEKPTAPAVASTEGAEGEVK